MNQKCPIFGLIRHNVGLNNSRQGVNEFDRVEDKRYLINAVEKRPRMPSGAR